MTGPTVSCGLCPVDGLTLGEMVTHLHDAHGVDLGADLERWPDGEPVVVDATLEPEDFR